MTQVSIQNLGNFQLPNEKAQDLKQWLADNEAVKTKTEEELMKEVIDKDYKGKELLNG
jgi:predicted transcriptional regulator